MIGASKILTVSYGTFSCTLEGFDEPFSTMKAIAEYFRDLAADDRYFGAEPPTPDAEMLHRIAEREIQRRVEAKISENGVVLRARSEESPAESTPAAAAATAFLPGAGAAMETPAEDIATPAPTGQPAPVAHDAEESIAAKLSRIRAVVSDAKAEAGDTVDEGEDLARLSESGPDDFGFDLDLGDDLPVMRDNQAAAQEDKSADEAFDDEDVIAEEPEADVEAHEDAALPQEDLTETAEDDAELEMIAEPEVTAETDGAEERADVEEPKADTSFEVDDEVEAEMAETPEEDAEEAETVATAEAEEEAEPEEMVAAGEEEIEAEDADDTLTLDEPVADAPLAAAFEDEADEEEIAASDAVDIAEPEAADVTETYIERVQARVIKINRRDDTIAADIADDVEETVEAAAISEPEDDLPLETAEAEEEVAENFEDEVAEGVEEEVAEDLEEEVTEDFAEEELRDVFTDDEADMPLEERTAAVLAALANRGAADEDYEAQVDEDDTEASDATLLAGIEAALGRTGLEPDAEEDLLRELADVAREQRRESHEGRAILENESDDGEASVERLMEEAKSKLEGDESRRRFSAIAHLKAAVAATVADRVLKSKEAPADDDGEAAIDRYRDDLSRAVRPRRPSSESAPTTLRPTMGTRPAPLVLVSEQRIDASEENAREVSPVRPRRVSASALTSRRASAEEDEAEELDSISPEEANSFAEFAERLGASGLSDLLEAAAAYTATVEGMPHFSRPQILRKVACMTEEEDYSREDSLRSFGMLLREGKIQKISRGQFTITDASRFMAEARHASR
ncbi:MAG: hypothetical protein R3E44_08350 [Paracoccaceae bacterium]